ncbi:MAG: SDR family NAD(P)-dependent oxidoreductase [Desulfobacteraceae bacterium]|nr:MAG: SDR family NAD(P)-dependent oxidoreductase [Desulfobacteraceae bacterium]
MTKTSSESMAIAIIGISCIFAESPDLKAFFRVLTRGINAVTDPPQTHRHLCDYYDPDPKKPDHIYCQRGGFLPRIDFDPSEFGIPPSALEATDSSQLLGLLVAKNALEDAGYGEDGKPFDRGKTSVILGVTGTQELVIPLGARLGHPIWRQALAENGIGEKTAESVIKGIADRYVSWQENSFPGLLGNVVAGRIANRLNLGGTNCVVDAACASSMSALHMALLELSTGRADMVLSGGVDTINDPFMHMCFSKSQILSASGDIRPFSQNADGTVLGEGVGIVVLKRLTDARRDGNRIYAVIRGLGSASDGKSQSIYAPRAEGQATALRRAYQYAGIDPESVELLEAHGTGTRVGDQTEFKALCDVFSKPAAKAKRCALGSVKSNIGHTKAAAGTAGLIKAALSLYHKILPPTLKALPADPKLDLENSPFYINHALRPWAAAPAKTRRAGVSAFGFGGSNFHAILEEHASEKCEPSWDGSIEIAAFSDATPQALAEQVKQWTQSIQQQPRAREISRLAAQSRSRFNSRDNHRMVMVFTPNDADQVLQFCQRAEQRLKSNNGAGGPFVDPIFTGSGAPPGGMAFLFPGQGCQYVGMGRDLICCFPGSLETLQGAERHFSEPSPLSEYIFPCMIGDSADADRLLRRTDIAQPAIGAVSTAMLEALRYFGVTPQAVCGHSYGELVALHAAGRINRETLWQLSIARGRFMAKAGDGRGNSGCMLAVTAPVQELAQLAGSLEDVVLANRNSPMQGVLSGATPAIEKAEALCHQRGWNAVRLPVAAAFHSPLVAAAQIPFQETLDSVQWHSSAMTVMSNTSGKAYPSDETAAKRLLGAQLAHPVDFVSNIEHLHDHGIHTFVEVGPKSVLTRLVEAILKGRPFQAVALDHSAGREFGLADLARTLAHLAALGHPFLLERWEKPTSKAAAPRMRISISGANYRSAQAEAKATEAESRQPEKRPFPGISEIISTQPANGPTEKAAAWGAASYPIAADRYGLQAERDTMNSPNKTFLAQALAAVQQGLSSMQALQAQTTQAHQKYLEAQTEANRTLQQMIQSTQRLAAAAMGDPSALGEMVMPKGPSSFNKLPQTDRIDFQVAAPQTAVLPDSPLGLPPKQDAGNANLPTIPSERSASNSATAQPTFLQVPVPDSVAAAPSGASEIQNTLIQIVSQLTGYPEEMLGLSMDIEADLGIDSIKRVEILSALEEQLPHLPKITPDLVGTLKTLGQICNYLSSQPLAAPAQPGGLNACRPDQNAAATSGALEIERTLVQIVSRLTGYPEEMLDLSMDIEADLGIDSIKRVEILSALEEELPHLPKLTPDMVGALKSLGQICQYLSGPVQLDTHKSSPHAATGKQADPPGTPPSQVVRYEILPFALLDRPAESVRFSPGQNQFVGIVCQDLNWGRAIMKALEQLHCPARILDRDTFSSHDPLAGLVICAPMQPWHAFEWAQTCAPHLNQAAGDGQALFFTVTRLDGAFGLKGRPLNDPEQGALAGLVKTAALEWPSVRCRALDVDPDWQDIRAAAHAVAVELTQHPEPELLEVGLGPEGRTGIQMVRADLTPTVPLHLAPQDVVIVTGGARGITAAAALALADHTPYTAVLVGRSPQPEPEPDWLTSLHEEGQIKKAILSHELTIEETPSPKAIEKLYRRWMANREMLRTLESFDLKGIRAVYYELDVRDADAMASTIARIRHEVGSVRGVIHGAGILEDRLIIDKTPEQFQAVYDTKVNGLLSFLEATSSDPLRYLILFSSISARIGNAGQADYAMANEALNKLAAQQVLERPDCKVVSINWGPWDGGMVTSSLRRNFEKKGVQLIPLRAGAAAMVDEMRHPHSNRIEVVLGGQPATQIVSKPIEREEAVERTEILVQAIEREIDAARCPVLQSHQLGGRPVVPLSLITEWLAHGALHANPGLMLHGIDHLRLLKGITLGQHKKMIQLMAGSIKRNGPVYEVEVEVRDARNGGRLVHSRAKAILTDQLPDAPLFEENGHFKATSGLRPLHEIYDQILFHGEALQGIEKIVRLANSGMTAQLRCAPSPEQWLDDPMRSRWIADPLVLDCAFQMAIIWCYEQQGLVCLPSYADSYRQYRDRFPADGVIAVLEVIKATDRKMVADFTFLDQSRRVVARMTGYEALMDPGLFKAFGVKAA